MTLPQGHGVRLVAAPMCEFVRRQREQREHAACKVDMARISVSEGQAAPMMLWRPVLLPAVPGSPIRG
jgi:hypothetical protein